MNHQKECPGLQMDNGRRSSGRSTNNEDFTSDSAAGLPDSDDGETEYDLPLRDTEPYEPYLFNLQNDEDPLTCLPDLIEEDHDLE